MKAHKFDYKAWTKRRLIVGLAVCEAGNVEYPSPSWQMTQKNILREIIRRSELNLFQRIWERILYGKHR